MPPLRFGLAHLRPAAGHSRKAAKGVMQPQCSDPDDGSALFGQSPCHKATLGTLLYVFAFRKRECDGGVWCECSALCASLHEFVR